MSPITTLAIVWPMPNSVSWPVDTVTTGAFIPSSGESPNLDCWLVVISEAHQEGAGLVVAWQDIGCIDGDRDGPPASVIDRRPNREQDSVVSVIHLLDVDLLTRCQRSQERIEIPAVVARAADVDVENTGKRGVVELEVPGARVSSRDRSVEPPGSIQDYLLSLGIEITHIIFHPAPSAMRVTEAYCAVNVKVKAPSIVSAVSPSTMTSAVVPSFFTTI